MRGISFLVRVLFYYNDVHLIMPNKLLYSLSPTVCYATTLIYFADKRIPFENCNIFFNKND